MAGTTYFKSTNSFHNLSFSHTLFSYSHNVSINNTQKCFKIIRLFGIFFFQIAYTQRNVFTKHQESKQNTNKKKTFNYKYNKVNVIFGVAFHWPELHN